MHDRSTRPRPFLTSPIRVCVSAELAIKVKDVTIEEHGKELDRYAGVVKGLEAERDSMRDDLDRIRGERSDLEAALDDRDDEMDELRATLSSLQSKASSGASEKLAEELAMQADDLREVLAAKDEAIRELEEELGEVRASQREAESAMREEVR